ncbi:uncharacterized protein WM294_008060 [Sarcoramphus papa]
MRLPLARGLGEGGVAATVGHSLRQGGRSRNRKWKESSPVVSYSFCLRRGAEQHWEKYSFIFHLEVTHYTSCKGLNPQLSARLHAVRYISCGFGTNKNWQENVLRSQSCSSKNKCAHCLLLMEVGDPLC